MAKNLFQFRNPLVFSGSHIDITNAGVNITGVDRKDFSFSIGQAVEVTSDVAFNEITPDGVIIGSRDSTHIVLANNSVSASNGTLTQTAGDYFNISGDLTVPNLTLTGQFSTDKIEAALTGSNTVYSSGSTEFGDTSTDKQFITGSLSISGSYGLNNSTAMVEISNDTTEDGGSQTALCTEYVAYNAFGNQTPAFSFIRKKYAHKGSFVSSTTSSFTAVTASAPVGELAAADKHDFMFFNQGMLMEYAALDVEQSSSKFLLKVNPASMGYALDSTDEVVVWGKFNSPGYLDFDGSDDEVTTDYSGSASPLNKTYSFWFKSTETAKNYAVFGYGSNKTSFCPNFSSGRILMWHGGGWYTYWEDTSAQDDGEWHHWMLYDKVDTITDSKLYVDGVLQPVERHVTSGTLLTHSQPLTIGAYKNNSTTVSHHFEGSIKEFSVFSGDKTSNAIKYYNKGAPYDVTNESDLQGYWKMYEGSGTTVLDLSGEGNHGTIDGASWNNM